MRIQQYQQSLTYFLTGNSEFTNFYFYSLVNNNQKHHFMSLEGNNQNPKISNYSYRNRDQSIDFQLPERSKAKILINSVDGQTSLRQSQRQDLDDEIFNLELLPESQHIFKQSATITTSQTIASLKNDSKNQPKDVGNAPKTLIAKDKRSSSPNKKIAYLQREALQKEEEPSKKLKNNYVQQNFADNNNPSWVMQNGQQMEIRKKIEQKIKNGYHPQKQSGGLKVKEQQLRRYNQLRERATPQFYLQETEKKEKILTEQKNAVNQPTNYLKMPPISKKLQKIKIQEMTYNTGTNKKENIIQQFQTGKISMTYASVKLYYQKQFMFIQSEINDSLIGRSKQKILEQQQEQKGYSICGCFGGSKRQKINTYNTSIAKRLVAISKKQVKNTVEELCLLKEIWTRLTSKAFIRYGSHWIQLGFQGKDPATDLRSTGVLSLLQWLQFIDAHPKLSQKCHIWSLGHYYPQALTFIQITDIFLDLLSKGMIKSQTWDDFQRCYNCLVLGMFHKLMEKYKLGQMIPNFVQIQANQLKKSFKVLLSSYDQEYKKMR